MTVPPGRTIRYDLIKELAVALLISLVVIVAMAAVFSSPDEHPVSIRNWAQADPVDFATTATTELAGTSGTAEYGPPYNDTPGAAQSWGPLSPQQWAGSGIKVGPPQDFVLQPLEQSSIGVPTVLSALKTYESASSDQQQKWLTAYSHALTSATVAGGSVKVPTGAYGPVPVLTARLLALGQSGALDGLLLSTNQFFATDYTKPLLFMGDGSYLESKAQSEKLTGDQWGMMNETGPYPGQAWLWLYTMWYQIPPFTSDSGFLGINAGNADLAVVVIMGVLTVLLALVPLIPGLRDIPRRIPVHKLIWRRYYKDIRD